MFDLVVQLVCEHIFINDLQRLTKFACALCKWQKVRHKIWLWSVRMIIFQPFGLLYHLCSFPLVVNTFVSDLIINIKINWLFNVFVGTVSLLLSIMFKLNMSRGTFFFCFKLLSVLGISNLLILPERCWNQDPKLSFLVVFI